MNLVGYTRRVEAAAADGDMGAARRVAAEVRAAGLDFEADLLLMVYGQRSTAALDRLLQEAAR